MGFEPINICPELRVCILIESHFTSGPPERKAQNNIGTSEFRSAEIFAMVGRRCDLAFQKLEAGLQIRHYVVRLNRSRDKTGNGFNEKWDGFF